MSLQLDSGLQLPVLESFTDNSPDALVEQHGLLHRKG
jgi:hypothetical protein